CQCRAASCGFPYESVRGDGSCESATHVPGETPPTNNTRSAQSCSKTRPPPVARVLPMCCASSQRGLESRFRRPWHKSGRHRLKCRVCALVCPGDSVQEWTHPRHRSKRHTGGNPQCF